MAEEPEGPSYTLITTVIAVILAVFLACVYGKPFIDWVTG